MKKITIKIELDSNGNFWVRKSGQHHAFKAHSEAIAHAEKLRADAQGAAEIVDLTDPVRRADA